MMFILFILIASLMATLSSGAMTHTLKKEGTSGGYLSIYFAQCFVTSLFVSKIFATNIEFNAPMSVLGAITGSMIAGMLLLAGLALKKGPAALTFAFLNSGAIVPPLLLGLLFKENMGFSLGLGNILGMALVVLGLFWAAWSLIKSTLPKSWLLLAALTFISQALILTIFQWRCLLFSSYEHLLIPFKCDETADAWFMPSMFFAAALINVLLFYLRERRVQKKIEIFGGVIGGIANALSTFFLLQATQIAAPKEKMVLFPLFTVLVILFCNILGRLIYKERIHWKGTICSASGILISFL